MIVRCKVKCSRVVKECEYRTERFLYRAEFEAVTHGSEENQNFFKHTPYIDFKIGTYKEDYFEPGKEYYIDITVSDECLTK